MSLTDGDSGLTHMHLDAMWPGFIAGDAEIRVDNRPPSSSSSATLPPPPANGAKTAPEPTLRDMLPGIAKTARGWQVRGAIETMTGHPEDAIAAYRQAITLDPARADPWNDLGDAYRRQERYGDAMAAFEQSAAIDPTKHIPGTRSATSTLGWAA